MYNIIYEEKDNYHKVLISEHDDLLFLHCYVLDKPSKSSLIDARKHFNDIISYLPTMGYKQLFALTPSIKFVRMVNDTYRFIKTIDVEGTNMELIVWDLK